MSDFTSSLKPQRLSCIWLAPPPCTQMAAPVLWVAQCLKSGCCSFYFFYSTGLISTAQLMNSVCARRIGTATLEGLPHLAPPESHCLHRSCHPQTPAAQYQVYSVGKGRARLPSRGCCYGGTYVPRIQECYIATREHLVSQWADPNCRQEFSHLQK